MRYGLNRLFSLASGVTELTSRSLGASSCFVNSISENHDLNVTVRNSSSNARQSLVAYPRARKNSSTPTTTTTSKALSLSPSHHVRCFSTPSTSCDLLSSSSASSVSWQRQWKPWPRPAPWQLSWRQQQHRSISLLSPSSHQPHVFLFSLPVRQFSVTRCSSDKDRNSLQSDDQRSKTKEEEEELDAPKSRGIAKSIMHRFHKAYKDYGKVLIGFHCVTYCVYFTSFLGISYAGLDVVLFLEWLRDHVSLPQVNDLDWVRIEHLSLSRYIPTPPYSGSHILHEFKKKTHLFICW